MARWSRYCSISDLFSLYILFVRFCRGAFVLYLYSYIKCHVFCHGTLVIFLLVLDFCSACAVFVNCAVAIFGRVTFFGEANPSIDL